MAVVVTQLEGTIPDVVTAPEEDILLDHCNVPDESNLTNIAASGLFGVSKNPIYTYPELSKVTPYAGESIESVPDCNCTAHNKLRLLSNLHKIGPFLPDETPFPIKPVA